MSYKIPFIKPSFPSAEEISSLYTDIVARNWYTNFGPIEVNFREAIEGYVSANGGKKLRGVTFNNATSALVGAIIALLGEGDGTKYIIMPSFTFVAGAEAILWCGYMPFFVDVELKTLQPNAKEAKDILNNSSEEIAAILLCNTFGIGNPRIEDWETLAEDFNKKLIIDSAAGFGSRYVDGAHVGTKGTCEIFSFHATKPFAIGEGGAVTTEDHELAARLKSFSNFGFDSSRNAMMLGMNAKLQEINAAIGVLQFKNFEKRLVSRRKTLKILTGIFNKIGVVGINNSDNSSVCFGSFMCKTQEQRDVLIELLNRNEIETRRYYDPAVHTQRIFAGEKNNKCGDMTNTEIVCQRILSVPVHDYMTSDDISKIKEVIETYAKQ